MDPIALTTLTLGCSAMFDAQRAVLATRLSLFPAPAAPAAELPELLVMLAESWPAPDAVSLNVASEDWLDALLSAPPPVHFWIEVPAFMLGDATRAQRLVDLAAAGHTLVLQGAAPATLDAAVRGAFAYAIVNELPPGSAVGNASRAQGPRSILAGLETLPAAQSGYTHGAAAVLGWPLADAPDAPVKSRSVPARVQLVFDLIQRVEREEPAPRIEAVLKNDPTLAFRLMRYINSPAFGLSVEINSFQHAVMILGYQRLKRWLALLAANAVDDPDVRPLMVLAVRRGLLMEELARAEGQKELGGDMFICGVFSLLDRMLGTPFDKLLAGVPTAECVRQALLDGNGPCKPFLDLALATEAESLFDIRSSTEALMAAPAGVNRALLRAVAAARQLQMN